jgi:hypothetical protein
MLLPLSANAAEREYLLRWITSSGPDVAGYNVYLASSPGGQDQGIDIGMHLPDPQGVASYLLGGLDSSQDYYVRMTAYSDQGLESVFSNEIVVAALSCDPAACNDGNPCTADACSGLFCTNDPVPEGTSCDDGNPATVQDACYAGICSGVVPGCTSDSECDDGNPCTRDRCELTGCVSTAVSNGTPCNDGRFCTVGDSCTAGFCQGGSARDCSALRDQCARGVCDEAANRCVARAAREGRSCDDGDACTTGEICTSGTCSGGSPVAGDLFYEINVDGNEHPILDASGSYLDVDVLDIRVDYDLAVDSRGKIAGTGVATHPLFGAPIPFMVRGRGKGRDHNVTVTLKFRLDNGDPAAPVKGSVMQSFRIDTLRDTYTTSSKYKVKIGKEKFRGAGSSGEMPLSALVGMASEGDWNLLLDVVSLDGARLEGDASLELSDGSLHEFQGRGSFGRGTGGVSLKLKGFEKGMTLKPVDLEVAPGGSTSGAIKYKVLGQRGVASEWTATASQSCGD